MRINTNITAMNTFTQYTNNANKVSSAVQKLSSGYAINSAADNAAGLAISEKMRAQIRGLDQASSNSQDAISLVQTAEGSLSKSTEILQRMREISVQSSSDTNQNEIDRTALQDEFQQLQGELNDISSTTTFNKKNLLDGSLASATKSVTNVDLANSKMAVSVGNASAGNYTFSVGVKTETAAVDAVTGSTTASMGSVAGATFSEAATTDPTKSGALYNGNYTLSTAVNDDGSLTVTATGDNDQNFTATVSASALDAVSGTNFVQDDATHGKIALNFSSSSGSADGFSTTLTLSSAASTSDNGLEALASSIDDVTVSIDGGVDAQEATYGVYASMTGGDSVKLQAGDTSATFSNGTTVSFDKLTATDVAVDSVPTSTTVTDTYSYAVAGGSQDVSSAFSGGSGNISLTVSSATLNNGAANLTGLTIKSVADSGGTGATFTLTDGTNDYTSTVSYANMKTLDGSNNVAMSFTGAGGTITAQIASDTDETGNTFTFGSTITSGSVGTITSTTATSHTTSVNTPSLSAGILSKMGSTTNQSTLLGDTAVNDTAASTFDVTKAAGQGLTFQVGANEGDEMVINIDAMNCQSLGVNSAKVDTQEAASAAISTVDAAINQVSAQRAYLGAIQNRLDYKIANLDTSSENLTSAESQIRDVDMAKEMTEFTNANILQQAATSMLAQANSLPQNVLKLLG